MDSKLLTVGHWKRQQEFSVVLGEVWGSMKP